MSILEPIYLMPQNQASFLKGSHLLFLRVGGCGTEQSTNARDQMLGGH